MRVESVEVFAPHTYSFRLLPVRPYQVAVVVGGIAEMFMVSKTTETLYLRKRKNFTKIAVEVFGHINE